jgi:sec-independent protein translocase protein TatC
MPGLIQHKASQNPNIRSSDEETTEAITPDTKPFLAHLEDLRWTIFRCLGALAAGVAICAFGVKPILSVLYRPLKAAGHDPKEFLRTLNPVDPFSIHMEIAIFGGLMLSLPAILYFLGQFLLPALTARERRMLAPIFAGGAVLFVVGVTFCYFVVLSSTLKFFFAYNDYLGFGAMWTAKALIDFEVQMLAGFGIAFEMPLVVLVLNLMGIVSASQLAAKRRHAAVIIFIASTCIIPSTDLFSLSTVSLPMYVLFELCILIARIVEKSKAKTDVAAPEERNQD